MSDQDQKSAPAATGTAPDAPAAPAPAADPVAAAEPARSEPTTAVPSPKPAAPLHLVRFQGRERLLHIALMASFLTLALTGVPLLFPQAQWAGRLARFMGGYGVTGTLHRIAATTLVTVFLVHLGHLLNRVFIKREYGILWGPDSLVPQPRDILQMMQHFRWFAGLGPRPHFDRFTYWEKFDYWAVFWGMAIIGMSGLMLWMPATFARVLPGWVFNIALVVHGEEALMAMVFIFTVHFFNGHLRPDKFPMDTVIFTGRVSVEELRHERPGEYERLQASGKLESQLVGPPSPQIVMAGRIIGSVAVSLGLTIAALAVYALLH